MGIKNYIGELQVNGNPVITTEAMSDFLSDYEENDSTKPSYILNKPFYTEICSEELVVQEDSPKIVIEDGHFSQFYYYKISENACPKDLLIGSKYTKHEQHYNVGAITQTLIKDTIDEIVINKEYLNESQDGGISLKTSGSSIYANRGDVHIVYDYTVYSQNVGIPFDSNGIYVFYSYDRIMLEDKATDCYSEVTSFTINETIIHKLNNKYVDLLNNEDFIALNSKISDIESALDNIIALQTSYIGGDEA